MLGIWAIKECDEMHYLTVGMEVRSGLYEGVVIQTVLLSWDNAFEIKCLRGMDGVPRMDTISDGDKQIRTGMVREPQIHPQVLKSSDTSIIGL